MNSSGIKRSLAVAATSALAVAGLPLFASSASATPDATNFGDNAVGFYAPLAVATISDKQDGTNTSASLVVGGGKNVTSVQFQYEVATAVGTWIDVPGGLVGRTNGVFAAEFSSIPANLTQVRAVPNTGLANVAAKAVTLQPAASAQTVELATEGARGVYQANNTENPGDFVAVTGTASANTASIDVTEASQTGNTAAADIDAPAAGANSTTWNAVLDISGYAYSVDNSANEVAINAATPNTDDAEGSTLYVQTIGSVDASPATQTVSDVANAEVVVTVLDTTGKPVAGAQVGIFDDQGTAATGDDTSAILGYTDGNGEYTDSGVPGARTFRYYANTTDADEYNAAIDPSDTAAVATYTPAFQSIAIKNERNRSNFDLDEFLDTDDFSIEVKDQNGNGFEDVNRVPQYRYVISPSAGGADVTTTWVDATTNGDGTYDVTGPQDGVAGAPAELPAGSYVLQVRRPAFNGTGFAEAAPLTFFAAESEISFVDGDEANAPVNGEYTVTGKLSLVTGGASLAGRRVEITYGSGGDSSIAPQAQQPAGTTRNSATTATAITDANGNFSVVLTDPDVPGNVTPTPETGTVTATAFEASGDATALLGTNGANDAVAPAADASDSVAVTFRVTPTVGRIAVEADEVFADAAPGKPVELSVTVYAADNDTDPANDVVIDDYPVQFTADKGFFSTDNEDGANQVAINDLVLDADNDDEGDLFGFYEDLGDSEEVSTGDDGEAGIIAAIERDEDFDDDGLSEMTVTITAGGITRDVSVEFDSREYLNITDVSLERAEGEPAGDVTVGDSVEFQLYTVDQFGNLVGDQLASISDDTPNADVSTDGDFGQTQTDFENDNAGISATSDTPGTVQTLMARLTQVAENLVDDAGNNDAGTRTVTESAAPINWVGVVEPPVEDCNGVVPTTLISGDDNGGKKDVVRFVTEDCAAGDEVKLFKIRGTKAQGNKRLVEVRETQVSEDGNLTFKVADRNGNKKTRFIAKVRDASDYGVSRSNTQKLR